MNLKVLTRKSDFGIVDFSKILEIQKNILNFETEKINNIINTYEIYTNIKFILSYQPLDVIKELNQLVLINTKEVI